MSNHNEHCENSKKINVSKVNYRKGHPENKLLPKLSNIYETCYYVLEYIYSFYIYKNAFR